MLCIAVSDGKLALIEWSKDQQIYCPRQSIQNRNVCTNQVLNKTVFDSTSCINLALNAKI